MNTFTCASLSPLWLPGAAAPERIALAAARAGGVGLLDAEFCPASAVAVAAPALQRLLDALAAAATTPAVGLRLDWTQRHTHAPLLAALAHRPHHLILCGWQQSAATAAEELAAPGRQLWLEIGAVADTAALPHLPPAVAGWVARGSECGGRCGQETAFILCQHLARQERPFWVCGGIGLHTAAACRAAGAAGVILDDALLLLRESPLDPRQRELLAQVGSQDTAVMQGRRVVVRPGFAAARLAHSRAADDAPAPPVGWGDPGVEAWPLGQSIGWAAAYARRYGTVGRVLQAVQQASADQIALAAASAPLTPGAPLAAFHGTRYPIVQGPMTRVSDRAEFAAAVAESGALPLLALAQLRGAEAAELLAATQRLLAGRPWGVGILGFLPAALREEQMAALATVQPSFALIAGGRPDQAAPLEARGIPTYLHAPTAELLRIFLEQGARRFVFEGAECGGHTGPLNGFALWESMVDLLLHEAPPAAVAELQILFAGGIHDARSAAMIAALAAPVAQRGAAIGVLMGTAYLFTAEAVACGAIAPAMQEQALACRTTVTLETGPGHVIRCAPTPFTAAFAAERARLRAAGQREAEITAALETLLLGRLRIAAKGIARDAAGLHAVDTAAQLAEGMFMMGEVAALRGQAEAGAPPAITTCADLHHAVSEESTRLLAARSAGEAVAPRPSPLAPPAAIAIVGVGCLLPGAQEPATLWRNLLDKVTVTREIPRERWDWRLLFDPDKAAPDKIYAKWGGFIDPLPFDPLHYGIPPKSLASISVTQLLALEATRRALQDAGYGDAIDDAALRSRTAVFFGAGNTGDIEQMYMVRSALPLVAPEAGEAAAALYQRLPAWSEESYPGILANVIAGRVANRFDLGGPNLTLDAACASSLAALDLAVRELEAGRSDLVLTGGVDFEQTPQAYMAFSKTQALSPTGQARVFDQTGDGIVISEGAVVLVLKRLADAERDGDRIYAVIRGVAGSSDGKGFGLTAPKPAGQRRAFDRAHAQAGSDPRHLGLYEAHATGTAVGDRSELEMITGALRDAQAPPLTCVTGSAKSLLGHTRGAAGALGVVKAALALHHRTLPPHLGATTPLPPLAEADSPLYLLDQAQPWLEAPGARGVRLAGVSAFGFGGANFHAVLEEYRLAPPDDFGAAQWPCELFTISGTDRAALQAAIDRLRRWLAAAPEQPGTPPLRDLAYTCAAGTAGAHPARLALVATDLADLRQKLAGCAAHLDHGAGLPANVFLAVGDAAAPPGEIAFLFPGQGSQYPGMGAELALYFGELRDALTQADAHCPDLPARLSQLMLPPAAFSEDGRTAQARQLAATDVAQPAIAALSVGMLDLAARVGLTPARVAGHSFGEFVALHAAGVIDRTALLRLAAARGRIMASLSDGQTASQFTIHNSQFTAPDPGAMAVAFLSRTALAPYLADSPAVTIANINAPEQCALSGPSAAIEQLRQRLQADGHTVHSLPVAAAFHSPLMAPARPPFAAFLAAEVAIAPPRLPVHANLDGAPYPADPEQIGERWVAHLENCVDFVAQVEQMYAAGVRTFVEIGPGRVLTGLVHRILHDRPHRAVATDGGGRSAQGGLAHWLAALAELFAHGQPLQPAALYRGRPVQWVDLDKPPAAAPALRWLIDGGRVWPVGATEHLLGAAPLLTQESSAAALAAADSAFAAYAPAEDAISQVYREYQETMRQFLAQQERLMAQVLGGTAPAAVSSSFAAPQGAAPPRQEPAPPPPVSDKPVADASPRSSAAQPDDAPLDRAELTRRLLALVSERTGYPAEMLDPSKDLEAELGVDSIKRIEILGRLPAILPADVAQRVRAQVDRLTRLKSLDGLVTALLAEIDALPRRAPVRDIAPAPTAAAAPPQVDEPALRAVRPLAAPATCPRYLMRGAPRELRTPRDAADAFFGGLVIVTEDSLGVGRTVCSLLAEQGAHAFLVQRSDLLDPERLERRVMSLLYLHGSLRGVVHLAALGIPAACDSLAAWRDTTTLTTKSFFRILQLCALGFESASEPVQIFAATQLGGAWGRATPGMVGTAAAGSVHGMLRTLESEYPKVLGKVVDFDAALPPSVMAQHIVDELLADDGSYEIGYPGDQRTQFLATRTPLAATTPHAWRPEAGWVVLVTGGARGITAEICRELAQPGVQLVIVGRATLGGAEAPVATDDAMLETDLATLRSQLIAALRAQGVERTPAEIESEARALQREHERRRNLAAFAAAGAEVEYHAIDVRTESAFGALIDDLYRRFGRIDAVVHGAGIIEDRQIEEKSAASFDRVFDTKADSAFILGQHLRAAGLRWVVFFSSVAGRFGNQGQVDYAAANEVVNRLACQFDAQWPATRVAAINWGPWRGAGMASHGIQRHFVAKGITPIEAADGVRFFVDELTYGQKGEVEVIAGEGPWKVEADQQLSTILELGALFLGSHQLSDHG